VKETSNLKQLGDGDVDEVALMEEVMVWQWIRLVKIINHSSTRGNTRSQTMESMDHVNFNIFFQVTIEFLVFRPMPISIYAAHALTTSMSNIDFSHYKQLNNRIPISNLIS
jgi:hypothetical protein